jgi:hypothetical protein
MPGSSVSAVQISAHRKLVLVNLILSGKVSPSHVLATPHVDPCDVKETSYPKFVNQQAITAFSTFAAEYADFAKAYAGMNYGKLKEFLNNADVFRRVSHPILHFETLLIAQCRTKTTDSSSQHTKRSPRER